MFNGIIMVAIDTLMLQQLLQSITVSVTELQW